MHLDEPVLLRRGAIDDEEDKVVVVVDLRALAEVLRVLDRERMKSEGVAEDVEVGRAIELDALVGAVREIGGKLGMPTPNIDALLGLTRLFGRVRGLYPAA